MRPRFSLILALLALGLAARLAPYVLSHFGISIDPENTAYPWNFSPILPVCIFGGAFYGRQIMVYAIPFATYLIGDLGIWALTGRFDWAFYSFQPVVYLSVALVAATGLALRGQQSWARVAAAGLISSVGFYLVTNFGLWAFSGGTLYPQTLAGLTDCYVRGIPYFRNTLISMAVFLPLLFSRVALKQPVAARAYPFASPGA
jgi:hypothetical protein